MYDELKRVRERLEYFSLRHDRFSTYLNSIGIRCVHDTSLYVIFSVDESGPRKNRVCTVEINIDGMELSLTYYLYMNIIISFRVYFNLLICVKNGDD